MDNMKRGSGTTEFWTTGATSAALLATGVQSASELVQCVSLAGAAFVAGCYAFARALEKRACHAAKAAAKETA